MQSRAEQGHPRVLRVGWGALVAETTSSLGGTWFPQGHREAGTEGQTD